MIVLLRSAYKCGPLLIVTSKLKLTYQIGTSPYTCLQSEKIDQYVGFRNYREPPKQRTLIEWPFLLSVETLSTLLLWKRSLEVCSYWKVAPVTKDHITEVPVYSSTEVNASFEVNLEVIPCH